MKGQPSRLTTISNCSWSFLGAGEEPRQQGARCLVKSEPRRAQKRPAQVSCSFHRSRIVDLAPFDFAGFHVTILNKVRPESMHMAVWKSAGRA